MTLGVGVSLKGQTSEQDNLIAQVGKGEISGPSNREDWSKTNFSQLIVTHQPGDYPWWVFEKALGTASYLLGRRTPIVIGGVCRIDGDILTDEDADFQTAKSPSSLAEAKTYKNSIIHGICILKKYNPGGDDDFTTIEANRIEATTSKTIKCFRDWDNQGGLYRYEVTMPMILGSANIPFSLLFLTDGIVLGEGARTANNPVSSIRWGIGDPEGVVKAAPGSMYLNQSGGEGTTLYFKESGGFDTTGWVSSPTETSTNTLTNKRITPRVSTETSSAIPTINTDNVDAHSITALATDITSMTTNLSGTPTNFQKLIIRIKDDGTTRDITWGASFENKGGTLPTATTAGMVSTIFLLYDTVTSKWGCVLAVTEL